MTEVVHLFITWHVCRIITNLASVGDDRGRTLITHLARM